MKERCDGLSSVSVICDAFFLTSVGSVKVTGPDISSVLFSLLFVCKAEKMLRKQFNEFQVREYDSHQPLPGKWYQGPILGTSAASLTGACARTFKPETWRFHHFFSPNFHFFWQIPDLFKGGYAAAASTSAKRSEVRRLLT